ncbi:MAG: hypothetical protein AB7I52_07085 [Rhizobiaceae bacterium]
MPSPHASTRAETLEYVQYMLAQLRLMAEAEHCDMLAYFIEMSYIEVGDIIRNERIGRSKIGNALPMTD